MSPRTRASRQLAVLACAWLGACALQERGSDASVAFAPAMEVDSGADAGTELADASRLEASGDGTVLITGHVNGGLFTMPRPPDSVCVFERPEIACVDTDEIGGFEIRVPRNARIALLIEGTDLIPTLRAFMTREDDIELGNTRVASVGRLTPIAEGLGISQDVSKGVVFFGGIEFSTAELEPPSGERYFIDFAERLVTDARWIPERGSGGFLNVDPGPTLIRFSRDAAPCAFDRSNTLSGWAVADDPSVALVPVLPGHHTSTVTMHCGDP